MSTCERTRCCEGDATGAIGLSGSTVSRRFIETSAAKRELQEQDLSGEDVVAMFMDGKMFAEATMVVVLGITMSGEKRYLGFVETDTENEPVLTAGLREGMEKTRTLHRIGVWRPRSFARR